MKWLFWVSLIALWGCVTPKERLDRLIKKHPELVYNRISTDTLIIPGESDSVYTNLIFNKLHIKFDSLIPLKYSETGKLLRDSFSIIRKGLKITIYTDSSTLIIKTEQEIRKLSPQSITLKGNKTRTTAIINDSSLVLSYKNRTDTVFQLIKCPEYHVCTEKEHHEIAKKARIAGFGICLLMLLSGYCILKVIKLKLKLL